MLGEAADIVVDADLPWWEDLDYEQLLNEEAPLNQGLVSRWLTLPGNYGGFKFFDLKGANHGTLAGGPIWRAALGRPGGYGAIEFDGTDDYVTLGNSASVNITGELTVSCWAYARADAHQGLVANGDGGLSNYWLDLRTIGTGTPGLRCGWGGGFDATVFDAFTLNRWHHVLLVRSGTSGNWTAKLWLNGALIRNQTGITGNPFGGTYSTIIGEMEAHFLNGFADAVTLYPRPLSDSEAVALYDDERQGYSTTLNRIRRPAPSLLIFLALAGGGLQPPRTMHQARLRRAA